MRLLQLEPNGEFSFVECIGKDVPPYAILSHTWGNDNEEVTFEDLTKGTGKNKAGYCKLSFCAKQAAHDGLRFFWVDTCCIDKSSSAELSEAIISMFRWYSIANKCYVYLSDVAIGSRVGKNQSPQPMWEPAFRHSKWFTRGWTLQELLAPKVVEFFSVEGERLGEKRSMVRGISEITGISARALQGSPLSEFSVNERMSWADGRQTKREEDEAYALLGIFDVHISPRYGEGREKAFNRLRREIQDSLKNDLDHSSSTFSTQPLKRNRDDVKGTQRKQRAVVCYKCKEPGHYANDLHCDKCGEYGHYANEPHCFKCGEYGHYANELHCDKCGEYGHYANEPHCFKCDSRDHMAWECPI